jgi:hypothetical protein
MPASAMAGLLFNAPRAIRLAGAAIIYLKRRYRLWLHYLVEGKVLTGCFAEGCLRPLVSQPAM